MADNENKNNNIDNLTEQMKILIQLEMDKLNAEKQKAKKASEMREIDSYVRDIKKNQDKYGRLSYSRARSWKDFGNILKNNLRLSITKNAIKKQKPGWTDEMASKAAFRIIASGSKGVGSLLTKFLPIMAGAAAVISSTAGLILAAVEGILKIVGEGGKYFKSTSMLSSRGALDNPSGLMKASILHAGYVNNPFYHTAPGFIASQEYKNAYRSMIESAVFSRGNYSTDTTIRNLITAFDDIAAQGIILGRSFQETTQLISSVGSQYFMGRSFHGLRNFSYVHDVMQRGRSAGFNDTNVVNMLTNYSKINAYNTNGAFIALNDISKFIRLISNNTNEILEKANPQQLAAQMQSVLAMNIPFGQFIALTKGLRSFGKGDLSNLAESYRKTGQLSKLGNMWETLKNATGMDYKTLMTVAPSYFGGLQGEVGENIIKLITNNKKIFSSEAYRNLSFDDALKKYVSENRVSAKDSAQIQMYAQTQLFFEQPLQTIIACLVSLGQSVVQIASVVAFGGKKPSAETFLNESYAKITNLNKFRNGDNGGI